MAIVVGKNYYAKNPPNSDWSYSNFAFISSGIVFNSITANSSYLKYLGTGTEVIVYSKYSGWSDGYRTMQIVTLNPGADSTNFDSVFAQISIIQYGLTKVAASPDNPTHAYVGESVYLEFAANTGYKLPEQITVTGGTINNWDASTGILDITNITDNITVEIVGVREASISYNLTNVAASPDNPTTAEFGGSVYLEFAADIGYNLPEQITVTGGTINNWDESTGVLDITNITGNITVGMVGVLKVFTITQNISSTITSDPDNPTTITYGDSANLIYSASSGYALPFDNGNLVTGASYDYDREHGVIELYNPTSNVVINLNAIRRYNIEPQFTYVEITNGDLYIDQGSERELKIAPLEGYNLPDDIEVDNAEYVYSLGNQDILLYSPTGDVVVRVQGERKFFSVSVVPSNITVDYAPTSAYYGDSIYFEFTANAGYRLPADASSITVTNSTINNWDSSTGVLSINNIVGNVTVTISAEQLPVYPISVTYNNVSTSISNPTSITEGSTATLQFYADDGYNLPSSVTVVNANIVSWSSTGTLVINNPTGAVSITVNGVLIPPDVYTITNASLVGCYGASTNVYTIVENTSRTLTYYPNEGYILPSSVSVVGATLISWSPQTGILEIANPTRNVTISIVATLVPEPDKATIEINLINGVIAESFGTVVSQTGNVTIFEVNEGSNAYYRFEALDYAKLPELISVQGDMGAPDYSYNNFTGRLNLTDVRGNVVVYVVCQLRPFNVDLSRDSVGVTRIPPSDLTIEYNGTATQYYRADEGFELPDNVSVYNTELVSWDKTTGELIIQNVLDYNEPVEVTIIATSNVYDIDFNLYNCRIVGSYVSTISANQTRTYNIAPVDGYYLPDTITVTGCLWSWNKNNAILTLHSPTDNVVVNITALRLNNFEMILYHNTAEYERVDKTSYLLDYGTITGVLREECSITSPIITIYSTERPDFNYVYIPAFNRYYFVEEIVSIRNSLWEVNMRVDVLMSFKTAILDTTAFINRNEYEYNPNIVDDKMVVEQGSIITDDVVTNDLFEGVGSYILSGSGLQLIAK